MTFLSVMGAIILFCGGITAFFFRKGGIYNPHVPESEVEDPLEAPVAPVQPSPAPQVPPTPVPAPVAPSKATLTAFCEAIRDFEGQPGDASYRNYNPGNVRFNYSGYLPMYGTVRCSPAGFAIFESYELGWLYLRNMVKGMFKNHPDWTILDFFSRYAPASDGNPVKQYATFVANRLGVDIHFRVSGIVLA